MAKSTCSGFPVNDAHFEMIMAFKITWTHKAMKPRPLDILCWIASPISLHSQWLGNDGNIWKAINFPTMSYMVNEERPTDSNGT